MNPYRGKYPVSKESPEYPVHKSAWAALGVDIEKNAMDPVEELKSIGYEREMSDLLRCAHDFRFLRQKRKPTGATEDIAVGATPTSSAHIMQMPVSLPIDIFFCTKCLTKREVPG